MNIRQIFGLLAAIACAGSVQAQRVGWEADFKTRFDNREFTGSSCNESQTIFLADLSTAVSYNWLDRNTLRFGVQMQKDFGDNRDYFSEVCRSDCAWSYSDWCRMKNGYHYGFCTLPPGRTCA